MRSESSSEEEQEEAPRARRRPVADEPDPAQVAADMERLKLIREKREADRLKRIQDEGFDRFAPSSDANPR